MSRKPTEHQLKIVLVLTLASMIASTADAQARRRVPRPVEPSIWGSASAGLFNANDVSDGRTGSTWDFGQASTPQFRLSLEKAVTGSISIGAAGSFAHVPFTYRGGGSEGCAACAAHLDVVALGASFHVSGGQGFHQVLEGFAGALQYRNFERDSNGERLEPLDGNIDPFFTFGYGFGYGFNRNMQVSVVQDFGLALHEREGLTSEQNNTLRQRTIRLNFRYGTGNRRRALRTAY
jgi:hypothetical protein